MKKHMDTRKTGGCRSFSQKAAFLTPLVWLAMPLIGGCSPANDNLLIGSWKFASYTGAPNNCASSSVFTEKLAAISYAAVPADPKNPYSEAVAARTANVPIIRYMPSATLVVALTGGAGYPMDHVNYNFTDKNHMWNENAWGKCYYIRTS